MRLLVGLGNPGESYANNRHNIGFMALDAIAEKHAFGPWRSRFQGMIAEGTIGGTKVLALKPMTYMNLSGQSVGEAARFYKIPAEDTVVFYDEAELAAGKIRVKQGGGSAGHNGIKSLDAHIGSEYWRVRMGVGRPPGSRDMSGHVLQNFSKADMEWLKPFLDAVCEAAPLLVEGDDNKFMTKVALLTTTPKTDQQNGKNGKASSGPVETD